MPRIVAVIQARTGSTRLPRKVLRPLGDRPVLAWVVGAARDSGACDDVVVATTVEPGDDKVAALATSLRTTVVRGPEDDVLARFLVAADVSRADAVVRLTADCPLLDPTVVATCVAAFARAHVDYVTTLHDAPCGLAHGFDVEVVDVEALRETDVSATGADRAHVTSYIAAHPERFRIESIPFAPPSADLRVTLDEPADADLLDAIVAELGRDARDWERVVALLRSRPELVAINSGVRAKPLAAG
jgi:spore coat polysaccharide biosynthesis protein SpsF